MFGELFNGAYSAREKRSAKKDTQSDDSKAQGQDEKDSAAKRLSELENRLKASEERERQAEKKNRLQSAEVQLRDKLSGHVSPTAMNAMIKLLRADGMFTVNDEGEPIVSVQEGKDRFEYGLDEGVKKLVKHPDFALFVNAPSSGGSGASAVKRNGQATPSYLSKPQHEWSSAEREAEYDRQIDLMAAEKNARQNGQ
jgi:hypothetical protein